MARLEAQKEICDAAEKELHKKYRQREDMEKHIRSKWDQARKRSIIDDFTFEERDTKLVLSLLGTRPRTPCTRSLESNKNRLTYLFSLF